MMLYWIIWCVFDSWQTTRAVCFIGQEEQWDLHSALPQAVPADANEREAVYVDDGRPRNPGSGWPLVPWERKRGQTHAGNRQRQVNGNILTTIIDQLMKICTVDFLWNLLAWWNLVKYKETSTMKNFKVKCNTLCCVFPIQNA